MYGRPDLLRPGVTSPDSLAAWAGGENQRVDVSRTYPVDRPELFQRGGHGLFGTAEDYFRFAQMLCDGGTFEGRRVIGRKTLELMHANRIPAALLPLEIGGLPLPGYGFGLGSRVALDVAATAAPGSVGEFGWAGAAKTHFWVDPQEGGGRRVHGAVADELRRARDRDARGPSTRRWTEPDGCTQAGSRERRRRHGVRRAAPRSSGLPDGGAGTGLGASGRGRCRWDGPRRHGRAWDARTVPDSQAATAACARGSWSTVWPSPAKASNRACGPAKARRRRP